MSTRITRAKNAFFLFGTETEDFVANTLPSNRDVLNVYFYHQRIKNKSPSESRKITLDKVVFQWSEQNIPTRESQNITRQFDKLYKMWKATYKNCKRSSKRQNEKQSLLSRVLGEQFDVKSYTKKNNKESKITIQTKQFDDFDEYKSSGKEDSDTEYMPKKLSSRLIKTDNITLGLTSCLDRNRISDRKAAYLINSVAHSLGHNINNLSSSRSSIRRKRIKNRKIVATRIKTDFKSLKPLCAHWDGKLLKDLTGKKVIDRLPVIVSGAVGSKLLGVPKLSSGTGANQAEAVIQLLNEWGLVNNISALCFDTTATNTGDILFYFYYVFIRVFISILF